MAFHTEKQSGEEPRRTMSHDPHRPQYHFLPASNWMNDPNGLIQWKGKYHLFYQYNPNGPVHADMHWGHAVSEDMVRWNHLPVALTPTPGGPDEDGCYSGCAVDDDGTPSLVYTGVRGDEQLPCIARTDDLELLTEWEKHPANPVIPSTPTDLDLVAYRDHCVWKEGEEWMQIIGAGIEGVGGAALLYRSPDLINWEYLHPLHVGGKDDHIWTGSMWECPDFFPLGDKHVLVVSVYDEGRLHYAAYFIGAYEDHEFIPESQGIIDHGGHFYAPQSMSDDDGRRIMWGWVREGRDEKTVAESGWAGVMSLPRVLSLRDGTLHMEPALELKTLRGKRHRFEDVHILSDSSVSLDGVYGDCFEIIAEFDVGGGDGRFGVEARSSPDGEECTRVVCDRESGELTVDRSRSGIQSNGRRESGAAMFENVPGETVELHIFVDRSVVEVFAGGRSCLTELVYPIRTDSLGIGLFASGGGAKLRSMDVWELDPVWDA